MKIKILKSKIHRATVTEACLDYEGSISVDKLLLQEAGILEYEKVHVLNVTNGERLITYAIKALEHSGDICINGAAAHLVKEGDVVIIVAYGYVKEIPEAYQPTIIHVNKNNQIV